jgi:hypothetical protein
MVCKRVNSSRTAFSCLRGAPGVTWMGERRELGGIQFAVFQGGPFLTHLIQSNVVHAANPKK